jgi:hypothetical protein
MCRCLPSCIKISSRNETKNESTFKLMKVKEMVLKIKADIFYLERLTQYYYRASVQEREHSYIFDGKKMVLTGHKERVSTEGNGESFKTSRSNSLAQ